jgi:hypothetical protein
VKKLTKQPTNKQTLWSTELLEKLTDPQVVREFPTINENWIFITASTNPNIIPYLQPDRSVPIPLLKNKL